jgi:hypothetical protein
LDFTSIHGDLSKEATSCAQLVMYHDGTDNKNRFWCNTNQNLTTKRGS